MRTVFVALGIWLLASPCFAQGEILDRGQSAFFVQGGMATGEDYSFGGFGLGYSVRGLCDLGIQIGSGNYEVRVQGYYPYELSHTHTRTLWSHAISMCEHLFRAGDRSGLTGILSLHQAFGWTAEDPMTPPWGEAAEFGELGAQGTLKLVPSQLARVLLSAGYVRSFLIEGDGESSDAFTADLTLALCSKDMYVLLTPHVQRQTDLTTYGATFSLMLLIPAGGSDTDTGAWLDGQK